MSLQMSIDVLYGSQIRNSVIITITIVDLSSGEGPKLKTEGQQQQEVTFDWCSQDGF